MEQTIKIKDVLVIVLSQQKQSLINGDRDNALIDKKLGMEYINHLEKDYNNKQGNPLSKATLRKKVGAVMKKT